LLQALGKHPLILSARGEAPFIASMGGAAYLFEFAAGKNYGLKLIVKGLLDRDISYLKKRYWCAKTFPGYKVAKGLMRLYPKTKFIYIIRNGCDVVQSMTKFSGFCQQEFEDQCRAWAQAVEKYRYLADLESAIEIRHEQMVSRPEELFQNIFSFLSVKNHESSANYVKNKIVHPLDKPTQSAVNVGKFFSKRKPSYESWSLEQREIFKRICGESMREAGYAIPY
jgi:sulfotransferase family protein